MTAAEQQPGTTWRDTLNAYWRLTKPGVIALLLVTTLGAMFVAQHGVPAPGLILATLLGGGFAAGAANAMNSYIERDLDKLMYRTSRRPMPRALVPPGRALAFSIALGVGALLVLGLAVNLLSAGLAALGYLGYVFLYTLYLKRATPQNVVIGGIAGALPPLVGYAAVAGRLDLDALYLFAIIFWWTPPHTWALTIMVADDYARGAVPMLPVAVGTEETTRYIYWYSILLVLVTLLPVLAGLTGAIYLVVSVALNAWHMRLAWQLMREPNKALARKLYKYSLLYLAFVYLAYVADRLIT